MPICPHCGFEFTKFGGEPTLIELTHGPRYEGIVYSCPSPLCGKLLGVSLRPDRLRDYVDDEIAKLRTEVLG